MISNTLEKISDELIIIRKQLHSNPELSGNEFNTAHLILNQLQKCSPTQVIEKVAGTGIVAIFDSNTSGPAILIRADIDALPIQEINDFDHKSTNSAVSHKCGHDGHTTILLGLAEILSKHPIDKGKVILLFQPAEETGMGAAAVLADSKFAELQIDYAFALHNLPGFPLHQIVVKNDTFSAGVKSIIIKLKGRTSHAAEPELGINPAMAMAEIFTYAQSVTNNNPEEEDFFLITPVYANMGEIAYGVSAGFADVRMTLRSWQPELMEKMSKDLVVLVQKTAQKYGLTEEISWTEVFYSTQNNNEAVGYIQQASEINKLSINNINQAFKWGEDFGLFTQRFKGAMFGVGAGTDTPALHNPDYDFPDIITSTAIKMFYQIIKKIQD